MTYNVFGGMLNLTQLQLQDYDTEMSAAFFMLISFDSVNHQIHWLDSCPFTDQSC